MSKYHYKLFTTDDPANVHQGVEQMQASYKIKLSYNIQNAVVALIPINNPRLMDTVRFNSRMYFWVNTTKGVPDQKIYNVLTDAIKKELEPYVEADRIFPLISPTSSNVTNALNSASYSANNNMSNRTIFLYSNLMWTVGKVCPSDCFSFRDENISIKDLIEECKKKPKSICLIVDRDNAFYMHSALLKEMGNKPTVLPINSRIIGFFSGKSSQTKVNSLYLPLDAFTACMLTPERVALSWHSQHFFKDDYFVCPNGEEGNFTQTLEITDENKKIISESLKATVESIAYKTLNHVQFVQFFRSDSVLSALFVNFVFATRILGPLNITPLSFPSIPDLSRDALWRNFDYTLDCLYKVPTIFSFNQKFLSFESKIKLNAEPNELVFELANFNSYLVDSNLREKAVHLLAEFLEKSVSNISISLYFNVMNGLFRLFDQRECLTDVIFCLIKLIAFYPNDQMEFGIISPRSFDWLFSNLDKDGRLLALILLCLISIPDGSSVIIDLSHFDDANIEEKVWLLHYISISSKRIYEKNDILQQILTLSAGEQCKDVKKSAINAMSSFVLSLSSMHENMTLQILEEAFRYVNESSYDVIYELLLLFIIISNFEFENLPITHKEKMDKYIEKCKKCENEVIAMLANNTTTDKKTDLANSFLVGNDIASLLSSEYFCLK